MFLSPGFTIEVWGEGLQSYRRGFPDIGDVIDSKKLIDQHYYAIASKATILKPRELNVPKDKFKNFFGLEWEEASNHGGMETISLCKGLKDTIRKLLLAAIAS